MKGSALVLALLALSPFAAVAACGGDAPPPAVPPPTTASSAGPSGSVLVSSSNPTTTSSAAPADSSSASPTPVSATALAAILTVDPSQVAAIASAAASAPAPKTGPQGSARGLEKGIASVASKSAPGMKPEGLVATGMLKEGDHYVWSLSLPPGKCYAIVGWSPTGEVQDLDLHLLAPPFFSSITGEDVTDDNMPVVGGGPNPMCPVTASPMPYKLDITAQKGGGHAAVQVYSKSK
jgi:hypothetical protein